jgi:hypothetical protein
MSDIRKKKKIRRIAPASITSVGIVIKATICDRIVDKETIYDRTRFDHLGRNVLDEAQTIERKVTVFL